MAKECMLSTGKLPLGGSVVRVTDRPSMTSAVNGQHKATNKNNLCSTISFGMNCSGYCAFVSVDITRRNNIHQYQCNKASVI